MNCCEKCFKDVEIKAIIKSKNVIGNCDFCDGRNVFIYNISSVDENDELKNSFDELIDIYSPYNALDLGYPQEKTGLIKDILKYHWNIFNLPADKIYTFITELLSQKYSYYSELFDTPVGINNIMDESYMNEYSILGVNQWEDFVKEIKENNRFHTNLINEDVFRYILRASFKQLKWELRHRELLRQDALTQMV